MAYARGKKSRGCCDRCGKAVRYGTLKTETVRGVQTYKYVCRQCWDPDHPQNWVGSNPVADAEALEHARPDQGEAEQRSLFGFNPVGNPGNIINTATGVIGVRTS